MQKYLSVDFSPKWDAVTATVPPVKHDEVPQEVLEAKDTIEAIQKADIAALVAMKQEIIKLERTFAVTKQKALQKELKLTKTKVAALEQRVEKLNFIALLREDEEILALLLI